MLAREPLASLSLLVRTLHHRGVLGSVAFGCLDIGGGKHRSTYEAVVDCGDDNHGREYYLLGQRTARCDTTMESALIKMGAKRREGRAEHNKKWPGDRHQTHVTCLDVAGHAHPDTLRSGTGSEAWIMATNTTTVRFAAVVRQTAAAFPAAVAGTVLVHFAVCYLASAGIASTRALAALTVEHPHVELVLHDKRISATDALFFSARLVDKLLRGGVTVEGAVDAAAEHMCDHDVLHLVRGNVRRPARRFEGKRVPEPVIATNEPPAKRARAQVVASTCACAAHMPTAEIAALVDSFAAELPPLDDAEVARGGYRPKRVRELWAAFLAKTNDGIGQHALMAWNAMRRICEKRIPSRLYFETQTGCRRFRVQP
jgi:hypothetical protein